MRRRKNDKIEWLEFELLANQPGLVHGVFLRREGSELSNLLDDDKRGGAYTKTFQELIRQALEVENVIDSHQVHGARVELVAADRKEPLPPCDGMITRLQKSALLIKHADCQAAIFYDPINRAVANTHSGWRGNVHNIYKETITKMQMEFGTDPSSLLVCISPSLGPNWAEFKHYKDEFPSHFWPFQVRENYFDLWQIARMQLEECGVLSEHIEIASICTYSNGEDFYSYRRDKTARRCNATVIALV